MVGKLRARDGSGVSGRLRAVGKGDGCGGDSSGKGGSMGVGDVSRTEGGGIVCRGGGVVCKGGGVEAGLAAGSRERGRGGATWMHVNEAGGDSSEDKRENAAEHPEGEGQRL